MIASVGLEPVALALGAGYLAVGIVLAVWLGRRGHPPALALGALACWPLFVPLLRAPARIVHAHGPCHARIVGVVASLREAMADPAAADLHLPEDLDRLVDELHRVDDRLAMVDRLLASVAAEGSPTAGIAQGIAQLHHARASAAAEIGAVLDGAVQLRLQIGLRSLAGNSFPVQERLRDLRSRLAAIDEIAALELHP
jgi:hypothetical protein